MSMRLCLVDDQGTSGLEPLTLTRPASELLLGATTLGEKIARFFGIGPGPARRGAVMTPSLAAFERERNPRVSINDADWLSRGAVVIARSRWVPPKGTIDTLDRTPRIGMCEGVPAFAIVDGDDASRLAPNRVDAWFEELLARPHPDCFDIEGEWIHRPWDLVAKNNAHIVRDFERTFSVGVSNRHLSSAAIVGPADRLTIHDSARIDPYVVLDTTNGPITVGPGVWIQPFTRVEGPAYVGARTQLFRANLRGGVTIGTECRVGGEVEATIVHGFSNKYHEGFLGHAYIGEWVNLGAITSNSDLRNDYGEVAVPLQGEPIPTGQAKVGCFVGDHTRTGMGSMLNTGSAIGVMCNVLPAGPLLPKHVPSFTAVLYGRVSPGFPLERMFETARIVKSRRSQVFSDLEADHYRILYEQTRLERERAFQRATERRNERWPLLAHR